MTARSCSRAFRQRVSFALEMTEDDAALVRRIAQVEIVLLDPGGTKRFALPRAGRLTIGRAPTCDIVIDDDSVSRRHAALSVGASFLLEDLGSANGTWVLARTPSKDRATEAPDSTRPGMMAITPGRPVPILLGQGLMIGSKLLVIRARAESASDAPLATPMKSLLAAAENVAKSPLSVLILGETGVGKDVLAETIHRLSTRSQKPLLRLNCGALSATLLESELFGHEQGAFTGAVRSKPGLLQTADGGTVFLDEIGELPLDGQVKLLRVLEDRRVTRVGGTQPIPIDVRFISATNRDLRVEVESGRFRQDLLFRLDGMTLWIPPLRERRDEIPGLTATFVAESSRALGYGQPAAISEAALAVLVARDWPGNIRELRHALERAVVLCSGAEIHPEHVTPNLGWPASVAPTPPVRATEPPLRREIAELERQRIVDALARSGGHQGKAAELLGISRRTLVTRLATFGLPRPRKGP